MSVAGRNVRLGRVGAMKCHVRFRYDAANGEERQDCSGGGMPCHDQIARFLLTSC